MTLAPASPRGVFLLLAALVLGACGDEKPEKPDRPITVTLFTLRHAPPPEIVGVTGVAEPYREADVGFEVAGRIAFVLDEGVTVAVKTTVDSSGTLVSEGEVIAEVDDDRYRQQWEAAKLRVESARAGLATVRSDIDRVMPATIARARAQREGALFSESTAKSELDRVESLHASGASPQAALDSAKNAHATARAAAVQARAALTEAEALLEVKSGQLVQREAELSELTHAVSQARRDLDNCRLRAPFAGRITKIHAYRGDFAAAGQPVVRLTMIDPIKASVTVSAARERELPPGTYARVLPRGAGAVPLAGTVRAKASVADAATRTYRVEVMVRNRRLAATVPGDAAPISFDNTMPVVRVRPEEGAPIWVRRECVSGLKDGLPRVFRLPGLRFSDPDLAKGLAAPMRLEPVPVRLVDEAFATILRWTFQRIHDDDASGLVYGDVLVVSPTPEMIERGVMVVNDEWVIRPGDLLRVSFAPGGGEPGLYVPVECIRALNDSRRVMVVDEKNVVRAVEVIVLESVGGLRRIEGPGLADGTRIVSQGVHYVFEGAVVTPSVER